VCRGTGQCPRIYRANAARVRHTVIGERGITLFGRSTAANRDRGGRLFGILRFLILDEASSGLDSASEKLVFEALDRLMEGKTSIVIAHRLPTIQSADLIFVVSDGEIAERGDHGSLLEKGGPLRGAARAAIFGVKSVWTGSLTEC